MVSRRDNGARAAVEVTEKGIREYDDFFLNNQPRRTNYQMLFYYKILHVSGIFSAHRQEFSNVLSALVSFIQFSDDR